NSFGVSRSPADRGPSRSRRTFGAAVAIRNPRPWIMQPRASHAILEPFYPNPGIATTRLDRVELTGPGLRGTMRIVAHEGPSKHGFGAARCRPHFPEWTPTW